ncbi:MAG: HlyD family secretion protein [Acidobacteria bacterium]|nr:MAG: HlyD family secretion protein [Acidobacteriota bacterium]
MLEGNRQEEGKPMPSSPAVTNPPPLTAEATEAPAPARRPQTKHILGIVVVIIVAGVIWAYFYYRNRVSTDDAQITAHIEPVAPRVAGTVISVNVNDNERVHAGQVLFQLDDRVYKAELQQADANLQAAEAGASSARTNIPITTASSSGTLSAAQAATEQAQANEKLTAAQVAAADAQVKAAQATLQQAQAQAGNAVSTERRYAQLVGKQEISALQYQQAQTAATAEQAGVAAAQAQVTAAQQQVASAVAKENVARAAVAEAAANERKAATAPQQQAVSRAQSKTAQAKVAQAEAAVALAQLNVDYTVVRSPSEGQVGNKTVQLGQRLAPGQTVLVIVPVRNVWVVANYKETQLKDMHPGQKADVSIDAYGEILHGTVNSIGPGTGSVFSLLPPENATGNYVKVVQRVPVKIVFDPRQDLSRLRPGLSVEATVFTNK